LLAARDVLAKLSLPHLQSQISYLVRSASIELTPREARELWPYEALLYRGTRVYLPHTPSSRMPETVAAVSALASAGMIPVPHIAARRWAGGVELAHFLDQLRDAGCNEALLVGGGARRPAGEFASAAEVLRCGVFERSGFRRIGIAGHPEGSPDVPEDTLREAFFEKSRFAELGKYEMYVVTQFGFESPPIIRWEKEHRDLGNRLPVHVGLPGVTSVAKLLRFAAICGVIASAGFLRQSAPKLGRLLQRWSPSAMVAEIAAHTVHDPACMIRQFHFFPFGGLHGTAAWIRAVGEGRYSINNTADGLIVETAEADS
jgi:methylenetetrahydrofolate reductase (NADPH)